MARIFKQGLRLLFAIEACGILYVLFIGHHITEAHDASFKGFGPWSYVIGIAVLMVFCAAFWTTRKPLQRPNAPAIAACLLNALVAIFFLYGAISASGAAILNATLAAASLAGAFLFFRRDKAAAQTVPPAKLADIPQDRTWRGTGPIVTLLFVTAAFILEHSWHQWATGHGLSRPVAGLMLLAIALALTVTGFIHESGHALVGAAFGMRLLALTIGPFRWARRDGQWKLKLSQQIFGGSVSSVPTHIDQPAWQDVLMVFAGPLANLCSAPVLFWITLQTATPRFAHLWFFFAFLTSLAIVVPILNLVPFRTATGSYSDGARIVQIFTASPVVEYQRALRALKSTLVTPLRPRDLDPAVFQRAAALRPAEYAGLHAHVCAAQIFKDQNRIAEAAVEIAAAEAIDRSYAVKVPALVYSVLVFFEAAYNRSAPHARLWWDRMNTHHPDRETVDYLIAAAALLWAESQSENDPPFQVLSAEAETAWLTANAAAEKLPRTGAYDATRDRLKLLRTLIDQAAAPAIAVDSSALTR
jgi:Zn-dependent protease